MHLRVVPSYEQKDVFVSRKYTGVLIDVSNCADHVLPNLGDEGSQLTALAGSYELGFQDNVALISVDL